MAKAQSPVELLEKWLAETPKQERDDLLNKFNNKVYEGESTNYVKVEYKAYGCFSGSYDGGGVDGDLYWSIDKAREKCLEQVAEFDKENKQYLDWVLKEFKGRQHKAYRAEKRKSYAPMAEVLPNVWRSQLNYVHIVEYLIK